MSSRGFFVDESLADGLEQLWSAGFETRASCGGDRGSISPGWDEPMRGYIAFVLVSGAQHLALQSAASSMGTELELYRRDYGDVGVIRFEGSQADLLFAAIL
jgi:hypothetical protein